MILPAPDRLSVLRDQAILDTPADASFDGIAQLASHLCDTPVALVSLVDADRQWFKARHNFPECETDLDRSVCRYVVQDNDLLVIPDLSTDSRTRDNPLVTDDPRIRFYAGAPLTTASGHVLGALCVIDQVPRPGGLTEMQAAGLRTLARQTVEAIELRRAVRDHQVALAERDRARVSHTESEERWQSLFRNLHEGFVVGRVIRDETGRICDWRYEEVNEAWSELVGVPAEQAIGRTIREVLPGIEEEWVTEFAQVVDSGETVRFTRQVGVLDRWYDGICQKLDADTFSVIFLEVTERIKAVQRREALLRLGDDLRDCDEEDKMQRLAVRIVGETLNASRTAYGELDPERDLVTVAFDWSPTAPGALVGDHRIGDYGSFRGDFLEGRPLIVEDVRADPITASEESAWAALGTVAVLNIPVHERGRTIAMFIVHYARSHRWTDDEIAFVRNAAERLEIGIGRLRAEMQQAIINAEITHRLKNSLAMVQAIASQTLRKHVDPEVIRTLTHRLQALGAAHDVLLARNVQSADLGDLIARVLDAAGGQGRYECNGPPLRLGARATLSGSLLFHELATNALKYGSLAVENGRVIVDWTVEGEGDDARITLNWSERGGQPAHEPGKTGFGSKLLKLGLTGTGGSELRYLPSGFEATFRAIRKQIEEA
jgi:PAS domain S-box-containing protein